MIIEKVLALRRAFATMDQMGPQPVAYEWRSATGCRSWPRPLPGADLNPPALLGVADSVLAGHVRFRRQDDAAVFIFEVLIIPSISIVVFE